LLVTCCKLDPRNLVYRQTLRKTEKAKYKNNMHGSKLALVTTQASRARLKTAKVKGDYVRMLECAEEILTRNPWDTGAQLDMAEAADALGLIDLAVWTLEQARQKDPKDVRVNRSLAHVYEKRGNFTQAIALWELVRSVDPTDSEAQNKVKNLAASDTIVRGHYEAVVGGGAAAGTPDEDSTLEPEEKPGVPERTPGSVASDRL